VAASKTEIEVDMTKHARFIMTFLLPGFALGRRCLGLLGTLRRTNG
jgi:hypothetical protein